MSIIAAPGATNVVQRFVLNLNTLLASTPQVEPARAGTKRRIARERAQAKAMTRQQRRGMSRRAVKSGQQAMRRAASRQSPYK
jgi:hypothetical protein